MIKCSFCLFVEQLLLSSPKINCLFEIFFLFCLFWVHLVPPLYIHIQGLNHPLTSGVKVHLSCSTAGARPVPQVVWMKGTQVMQGASQTVRVRSLQSRPISHESKFSIDLIPQTSANGNITTSDIVYLPSPEDNGKVIACSVPVEEKNNAPTLSIKDTRVLDIKRKYRNKLQRVNNDLIFHSSSDAPIVTLSLGSNLDPKNLAKGTDVYLECRIEANPPIKKIEWYHNNKPLHSSRGIIITNQSLVLQSISKQTHGQYMCRAANTQGSVSSNDLYLDIKCKLIKSFPSELGRFILCHVDSATLSQGRNAFDGHKHSAPVLMASESHRRQ